jgi:uncharacterized protein (TIGR01777 family)
MNITLTGATGFIGQRLARELVSRGEDVTILTRRARAGSSGVRFVEWDAISPPPVDALAKAEAVIHLAGEPVAQRWSADVKGRIRSSRVQGTRALVDRILAASRRPAVFVSASAIGIYGHRGDEVLTEMSGPGTGFLADVSVEWERESTRASTHGIRVVNPRIGIVLGADGGALQRMLPPFKAGVGGRLGSGRQWMSWIHVEDLVSLILFALDHDIAAGPVNGTAPAPVRNDEFTAELASVLHRPALFPVPGLALRVLFGEMSDVLLSSQRVLPRAAEGLGFQFRYPTLRAALRQILD